MTHRISVRDILVDDLDDLFNGEKVECMYCDPPWGAGHLKIFRGMNGQKGVVDDWNVFIKRLKYLYERHVDGPLFLEMGPRFENDFIDVFGTPSVRYQCLYGSGKNKMPFVILGWGAVPKQSPVGKFKQHIPITILSSLPTKPNSVFDCCVGLGQTARACKAIGSVCFANELNPDRAARTMKILDFKKV